MSFSEDIRGEDLGLSAQRSAALIDVLDDEDMYAAARALGDCAAQYAQRLVDEGIPNESAAASAVGLVTAAVFQALF